MIITTTSKEKKRKKHKKIDVESVLKFLCSSILQLFVHISRIFTLGLSRLLRTRSHRQAPVFGGFLTPPSSSEPLSTRSTLSSSLGLRPLIPSQSLTVAFTDSWETQTPLAVHSLSSGPPSPDDQPLITRRILKIFSEASQTALHFTLLASSSPPGIAQIPDRVVPVGCQDKNTANHARLSVVLFPRWIWGINS